ncbi:MAG: hypothetical protein CR979_01985 [Propionibacterium sp.]|nr:MAG: hypothetical protein CR979_01985 [Propionibacterium sp.]
MNRIRAMVFLLASISLLAGCGMHSPNVAAIVDNVGLPESTVTAVTDGCREVLGQEVDRNKIAVLLVRGDIARKLAETKNIKISKEDLEKVRTEGQLERLEKNAECAQASESLATFIATIKKMGEKEFLTAAAKVNVEMNPRYGSWISEELAPNGQSSISQIYKRPGK